MAAETYNANNDGNNIKWLFVVVFRVSAVLFLGVSWRQWCWWAVFIKLQVIVFPAISSQWFCVGVFLGISYYLGAAVFQGIFQWLILTFIYYYIYIIIHFCLVFFTRFGFLQLPHTYITIVSGFVLLDLVDMLLSLNLPCIILLSLALKIFFPQDFSLLFEINCKNCKKYFM